ncbi:DNA helicase/exodeoxyribonuclease V, subunit A [Palleronia marisminoris]|uniref:DNA 3'-5' helicase n=1 Tax=Palleronia marisminoris TaxID=315423 RepID=A0A1Y5T3X3_9RHOB|nr:DNA helicase/exodeoxyribonuclease V, subunit A [Palleronia marisminoris]SLN51791.1 ATP-dependent helicase/nuclease subunit A [Palleronia marisminoris]
MRDEATTRQITAARPDRSTWLSANAGSGKTRVLTDRVARLLLAGVQPQNILCLTYTKAAASEMQNRLFATLGRWAMMPDTALFEALDTLGAEPAEADLARARRLFAQAIETPGGLRIQTIHSFCAVLLRRFPLEAQVSPSFTEMDDRSAAQLREGVLEAVAEAEPDLFRQVVAMTGAVGELVSGIVSARDAFVPVDEPGLRDALDLKPDDTFGALLDEVFEPGTEAVLRRVATAMASGGKTDQSAAPRLAALAAPFGAEVLDVLEDLCLYGAGAKEPFGAKCGKFPTKAVRTALGDDCEALDELMERVAEARATRLSLAVLDRSLTLNRFAQAVLTRYEAAKQARGWLDFDDLILGARDLLTQKAVADWVLYRLDGGIDHILVDEAQDTSPVQWTVIGALAREFAAGHGRRESGERTIFVVGDKKQSIYSFQGADPEGFDRMHDYFAEQLGPEALQRLELQHSFRSAPAVLGAVDAVFAAGLGGPVQHHAFKAAMPGRVDLWPMTEGDAGDDPPDWEDPVDSPDPESAVSRIAGQIAGAVKEMIDRGETIPDRTDPSRCRPVRAGDVLILVRSRSGVFHPLIRACKAAGLDIAGADVLTLEDDLAVRDILSLLKFLALEKDDLALAEALGSPLFGLSEGDLYDLAHGRSGSLWDALRRSRHAAAIDVIRDLRDHADYVRPYELIDRLLVRHGGRSRLIGRLGVESEDAIDALLGQALDYERSDVPSLAGFLAWFEAETVKIKRQAEGAGNRLRVMTVHGAKGLEAPVVILADTTKAPRNDAARFVKLPDGPVLWSPPKEARPPALAASAEARAAADAAERERLLYVAMTRAESWLICCGPETTRPKGTWYESLEAGMAALETVEIATQAGPGRRFEVNDWAATAPAETAPPARAPEGTLAPWFDEAPSPPPGEAGIVSPSGLGGAKALPGEVLPEELDEDEAIARGSRIHLLLEHLPMDAPEIWDTRAARLLAAAAPTPDQVADALDEARRVLGAPDLREMFNRPALKEVDLVAPLPSGDRLLGAVDRLIVGPDSVLAIDYKSNRIVPEMPDTVPEGLLRQMGAYAHALGAIYPGRRIETALLWTRKPLLMPLPGDLVAVAFARTLP